MTASDSKQRSRSAASQTADDDATLVHRNEIKEQHTTHWDLDVLTDEELDQVYARERAQVRRRQRLRRLAIWAGCVGAVTLVVTAILWWVR